MNKTNHLSTGEKIFLLAVATVSAILLRIYFLKFPGYEFDIGTFIGWGDKVRQTGIFSLYLDDNGLVDYPPLVPLLTSWWLGFLPYAKLSVVIWFKLLPTLAEIIILIASAWLVFKSKASSWFLVAVIVAPALSFVTSAWGQVDAIMTALIMIGFLFSRKNEYAATFFLVLSFLAKPQAAVAIFTYLLWLLFNKGAKKFLVQLAFGLSIITLVLLVFYKFGSDFAQVYINSASRYPYLSMNAFNFWWLLHGGQASVLQDSVGAVSAKTQVLTVFVFFLAPMLYYLKSGAKTITGFFWQQLILI